MNRNHSAAIPLLLATVVLVGLAAMQVYAQQVRQAFVPLRAGRLELVKNDAIKSLTALCEADGQIVGANQRQVVRLAADGSVIGATPINLPKPPDPPARLRLRDRARGPWPGRAPLAAFKLALRQADLLPRVTGICRYSRGTILVADSAMGAVYWTGIMRGRTVRILTLNQLKTRSGRARAALAIGKLSSIAFDGRFAYLALAAGYSSSILKVDLNRKLVVAHAWAPGPAPSAMDCSGKDLFVVDARSKLLRRFNAKLKLDRTAVRIPDVDPRGLIIGKGNDNVALQFGLRSMRFFGTLCHFIPPQ